MARVTVEDCLEQIGDRFTLVHIASQRVRQLSKGARRMIGSKNKNVVEALREIANGRVRENYEVIEEDQPLGTPAVNE